MFYYNSEAYIYLNKFIDNKEVSSVILINDENTNKYCLPLFKNHFTHQFKTITIKQGDENKNIDTLQYIWNKLIEFDADRKSLIINLGGGVITDIGGFAASTFKRGIRFVHIPTTLLGMVDASIGGKNGINFGGAKNQIGNINNPNFIIVDKNYLKTLPFNELMSGYAEMLKHGLIADKEYWNILSNNILNIRIDSNEFSDLIKKSINIKNDIVSRDPFESGIRKALNFGHTLGHAIESYTHSKNNPVSHGHAVALGMILALHISFQNEMIRFTIVNYVSKLIISAYDKIILEKKDIDLIKSYLKFDKKNVAGETRFVLLSEIGKPLIDQAVSEEQIDNAFYYLINL